MDGTLYWGSGYRNIPPGIGNNKVYAFALTLAGEKDSGKQSNNPHGGGHGGDHGGQK